MSIEINKGKTKFIMGIAQPTQMEEWLQNNPSVTGVCFVGRSNVGKSTLINSIFGNSVARVSKTPGRTREINIFTFELLQKSSDDETPLPLFYLFDLPGYGFSKVSKGMSNNWSELMDCFFKKPPKGLQVVNLQDARHPYQQSDLDFQNYLSPLQLHRVLVFNKMDKLKTQKERAQLTSKCPDIYLEAKQAKQIFFLSAKSKKGIDQFNNSMITFLLDH